MQETCIWFLGGEDPLKKERATHSSILAWEISWTEEPGGLQVMGSQRAGHDLVIKQQHTYTYVWNSVFVCVCVSFVFKHPAPKKGQNCARCQTL